MKVVPMQWSGWTTPGYNKKTRIKLPEGLTFHELVVSSNLKPEQILWVAVKVGTDTIVMVKGTDLRTIVRYTKRYEASTGDGTGTEAVNELVVPFADIANLGIDSRYYTALVTSPGEQIYLELTIGAGVGVTPPDINLKLDLEVSANDPKGRRFVPRLLRGSMDAIQQQRNTYAMERGDNLYYRRIHVEHELLESKINKDGTESYDRPFARNANHLKRNDRAPQPGYTHLDFIASDYGYMDKLQANAKKYLNLIYDVAAPAAIEMLIETVEDLHPEWDQKATA